MTEKKEPVENIFHGISASPGLVHGPAFVFLQRELEVPVYGVSQSAHEKEIKRFEDSISKTRQQIVTIRDKVAETLGENEAKIFDAHLLVLEDKALIEEVVRELEDTSYNVEYCFNAVSKRYMDAFERIDDDYIRERASDIKDVARRVLRNLLGQNEYNLMRFHEKRVIVSEDLSPSDTAEIHRESIIGILTNKGSRTSHAVIMARALQIPAVVGLHDITEHVRNDDYVIVDGYDGVVIVNPTEDTKKRYLRIQRERQSVQKVFESVNPLPTKTKDGTRFQLMVNVEGGQDLRKVHTIGSDGVGLFRTEALFLRCDHVPSEDEQFEEYRSVVEGIAPLPVTIRTIDLGGDKRLNTLFFSEEEVNPFMGFRAIRLCLEHKELFKSQLRAILRASTYGNIKLMYPMITSADEIIQANEILEEAKQELRDKGVAFDEAMPVGSMIETPSAAMTIDLLAQHCQFLSIGTNDLIQYMLAVDRVNDRIAHLYQPNHPSVVRVLNQIITDAHKYDLQVSVCGEMAGDPLYAALLIGMGIDSLSVTPSSLPEVKYLIRSMKYDKAQQMAQEALAKGNPHDVLKLLRDFYLTSVGDIFKQQD